jgi:2,4-dienoyl-CoA reductase-like NADH-dependent reductase (Old Yellow Enzyme family)
MPLEKSPDYVSLSNNERMREFYRERARGSVAMIVLDCPCLDFPRAYKGPNELRFDTPDFASGIKDLLEAIHAEGAKAFMQLNYPKERVFDHEVPGAKQKGNVWIAPLVKIMTSEDAREILFTVISFLNSFLPFPIRGTMSTEGASKTVPGFSQVC